MIWIETLVFYLINVPIVWMGFELYARALKAFGRSNIFLKTFFTFLIYVVFSVFIISPILIGLGLFSEWGIAFREDKIYMFFFLLLYIFSLIPGFINFKKTHLGFLRRFGYFNGK